MDSINMITKSNLGSTTESQRQLQIEDDQKNLNTSNDMSKPQNFIYSEIHSRNNDQDSVLGSIRS